MPKKIWRKNFEIKKCGYQFGIEASVAIFKFQPLIAGKYYLTKSIWMQENGDNTGTYFVKDELRGLIDATLDAIINKTGKISAFTKKPLNLIKNIFLNQKSGEDGPVKINDFKAD